MAGLRARALTTIALALGVGLALVAVDQLFSPAAVEDRSKLPDGRQRAFPSAEGRGAAARGGRGGRPIFVTTLAESGEGSLRACVEASGPRTCIFRVSGLITLSDASLVARHPFLTIAGETAPGEGVAIRNGPTQLRPSLEIMTHDVIVRHLRLRPGPHGAPSCCSGALGLYGATARDIMIDHVSASWGSDETIDSEGASSFTVQWSIISEPLLDGGPGKANRARNMLLTRGGDFSVRHNLFAFGLFRNPQIAPETPDSVVDIVNNVLYSPSWEYVISLDDRWTDVRANIVGNYKINGTRMIDDRLVHLFDNSPNEFLLYLNGNVDEAYIPEAEGPQGEAIAPGAAYVSTPEPHGGALPADTAAEALRRVLDEAGATRPARDRVDRRIVARVRDRQGDILRSDPERVGGWPVLRSADPPADDDGDGMPNAWEGPRGLDQADHADGPRDDDGDGWTNLEEYLHEIAGDAPSPEDRIAP